MSEAIDLSRLGRYFDGIAAPEERAAVESWIAAEPGRRAAVEALRDAWNADATQLKASYDVQAAWVHLSTDLGFRRARRRAVWAAAILAVAGTGVMAWWLSTSTPAPQPVAQAPAMREYATPRGRRAVFRLLDGSEITLNADSRLRVPVAFGEAQRDVHLDGEAYFSVVHDRAHPFVVHTARGAVRDVGTRFGVRAYADAPDERVAVAEGAVAVGTGLGAEANETALRAGEVATLTRKGVTVLRGPDVADELAWTDGRLVFASAPLGEVARRLGRWYDLDVRVADPVLLQRPVTGSYSNEAVAEVLTLITSAVGARFEWRGRVVTINGGAP